ncbi:MAG: hypothetical protein LBC27_10105 [Spirochaetaceae bacterium]|jgi:hypothetical protein|nr:hypothetical protein [Spirochaetaceae bacterium]
MKRIYRAQAKHHEYLIPTALRDHNLLWLDKNIPVTEGISLSVPPRDKSGFPKPEYHFDERSIRAYYLSIRHIINTIHNNQIFKNFALLDQDCYDLFKDVHDGKDLRINDTVTEFNRSFMDVALKLSTSTSFQYLPYEKLPFLKLSHHFQHFNLNFDELPYVDKPPYMENQIYDRKIDTFPTMCLDFSDDLDIMKAFGFINDNSIVYSINIDEVPQSIYDSYHREYDWMLNGRTPIGKNTNKLMKLQKGYCIYWPWKYTIEEMKENKMFDFKVEQITHEH